VIYRGWYPFLFSEDATVPASSLRPGSDASANRKWVERLERFAASNQTVAAFCTAEGVSLSNFYLWRRRLAQPTPSPAVDTPTVVPIRVALPQSPVAPIEVALPSGTVVRFPTDTCPEVLVAILHGLEDRRC
jgi:transposase